MIGQVTTISRENSAMATTAEDHPGLQPLASKAAEQNRVWRVFGSDFLIALPFLLLALAVMVRLVALIPVHADTSYPESASVYAFLSALRTGKLYSHPLSLPWNEQMYGPLFYAVGMFLAKAARGNAQITTELARAISVLAFCGAAVWTGYLSWRIAGNKRKAAVATVMGLGCCWAYPFAGSARPDAWATFLMIGGLVFYSISAEIERERERERDGVRRGHSWWRRVPSQAVGFTDSLCAPARCRPS